MIPINFSKARAEHLLDCLARTPAAIDLPEQGWTADHLLALAGTCFCILTSQGPRLHRAAGIDVSELHDEHREAIEASVTVDLHAAIEWTAQRCFDVVDGTYDQDYEPDVKLLLHFEGDHSQVRPVEGFKNV